MNRMRRFLEESAKHAVFKLGQALQGIRYLHSHPDFDEQAPRDSLKHVMRSMRLRARRIANDLFFVAVPPKPIRIVPGDFSDPRVLALLREHLAGMHENSPPGSVYALDTSALQAPELNFVTAWQGDELVGCGALKQLNASSGELKSMRTAAAHLRRGVASRLLEHLLALARSRGYVRVSLETGSGPAFEPALSLYRKYGFENGTAFGEYRATSFNQFLHLKL